MSAKPVSDSDLMFQHFQKLGVIDENKKIFQPPQPCPSLSEDQIKRVKSILNRELIVQGTQTGKTSLYDILQTLGSITRIEEGLVGGINIFVQTDVDQAQPHNDLDAILRKLEVEQKYQNEHPTKSELMKLMLLLAKGWSVKISLDPETKQWIESLRQMPDSHIELGKFDPVSYQKAADLWNKMKIA